MRIEWKNKTWKTEGTKRHAYIVFDEIERKLCGTENEYPTKTITNSQFLYGKKCKKCEANLSIIEKKKKITVIDFEKSKDFVGKK